MCCPSQQMKPVRETNRSTSYIYTVQEHFGWDFGTENDEADKSLEPSLLYGLPIVRGGSSEEAINAIRPILLHVLLQTHIRCKPSKAIPEASGADLHILYRTVIMIRHNMNLEGKDRQRTSMITASYSIIQPLGR